MHTESFLTIIPLGILLSVLFVSIKKKKQYILMGMICAIFGSLFLKIKRDEDLFIEPYSEHPEKKIIHYIIGIFISIGLTILYSPLISWGIYMTILFFIFPLLLFMFIILNNFNGLLKFFRREKLQFISKGMVPAFFIGIISTFILSTNRWA